MHDLVAVAAQDELTRRLEHRQHQRELHGREVLHLVDHDEVVDRRLRVRNLRAPLVCHQVAVM